MPGKGYFDRTPRPTNQRTMHETLALRTGKLPLQSGDRLNSVPSADARFSVAPTLTWLPRTKGMDAIVTDCGRYSVSGAKVLGEWRFTAWKRKPLPESIGEATKTPEEAKQLCLNHLQGIV